MANSRETQLLSNKWLTFSILGTVLMGAGLVVLMEGIVMRVNGSEPIDYGWVIGVAIIIFSAGINFIGNAVKYRIYLDRKRKQDSEFKGVGSHGSSTSSRRRSSSSEGSSRRKSHSSSED